MMRIGQRPLGSNSLESKYKNCRRQEHCHYLEPDVYSQRHSRVSMVEAGHENSCGEYEEEGYCCHNAMALDDAVVAGHVAETVPHT